MVVTTSWNYLQRSMGYDIMEMGFSRSNLLAQRCVHAIMVDESPFTIRDRRRSQDEAASHPSPQSPPAASPMEKPSASPHPPDHGTEEQHAASPPATFSELIYSLGTSAFAALGVQPGLGEQQSVEATTGGPPVNLNHARHLIDLLGVLEQKTAGNLSSDEQQLLQQLLYALRLSFVEQNRSGPVAPPGDVR
jgi:hypothetical protein